MTIHDQLEEAILKSAVATENLRIMMAAHALDFRNGSITFHYDLEGRIRKAENHLVSFKS